MTPIGSTFSIDINSKLDWETLGQILATGHSRVPVYSGDKRNVIGLILVKSLIAVRAEDETLVSTLSIRRLPRVTADTPLYDVLNEFQRGQSHMAAVVRTPERSSAPATEGNHINGTPFGNQVNLDTSDTLGASSEEPLLCARDMKPVEAAWGSCLDWKVDMVDKGHQVCCKPERSTGAEATKSSCNAEESEVIGIITLEDVFEELIQEEIVDETDEYVDVHRRIKVNGAHRESPPGVAQNGTDEICLTLSGTSVSNLTEPLLDKAKG